MVLIFDPVTIDVINISTIGARLIKVKKSIFLSLKLILNLYLLINREQRIKNGIKIPICLTINISGLIKWFSISKLEVPVLANP